MNTQEKRFDHLNDYQLIELAAQWQAEGQNLLLVFVMQIWGSAPRQAGAVMVIRKDGVIAGSVSGGCIEGAVIEAGSSLFETGEITTMEFGVADETAWEVGLSCGGRVSVVLVPVCPSGLTFEMLQEMAQACSQRKPLHLDIDLVQKQPKQLVTSGQFPAGLSCLSEDGTVFSLLYPPPPRLVIIGAVHIAQILASMAVSCGFQVEIIDPRGIFAREIRFPETITLHESWPSETLDSLYLDASTALVTLTHDPKIDDDALLIALSYDLFYLACLGSRRTHAKRLERLAEKGIDRQKLDQISGPAGLDIKAKSPAEIAVSILAEMIAMWRKHGQSSMPVDKIGQP